MQHNSTTESVPNSEPTLIYIWCVRPCALTAPPTWPSKETRLSKFSLDDSTYATRQLKLQIMIYSWSWWQSDVSDDDWPAEICHDMVMFHFHDLNDRNKCSTIHFFDLFLLNNYFDTANIFFYSNTMYKYEYETLLNSATMSESTQVMQVECRLPSVTPLTNYASTE